MSKSYSFYAKNGPEILIDRYCLFMDFFDVKSPDGTFWNGCIGDLVWHAKKSGNTHYAYARLPNHATILLHRLLFTGVIDSTDIIDHINGNGLDNRMCNLRTATVKQNAQNQRKTSSETTSRYKGVYVPPGRKPQAYIHSNGRKIHLGTFPTQRKAAKAYDQAALVEFGEYANVNFPSSRKIYNAEPSMS